MKDILFITHRMPYPPNKGDKIRAYQLLKQFKALGFKITLAFPSDSLEDSHHIHHLSTICETILWEKPSKIRSYYYALKNFLFLKPLSIGYFYSKKLHQKINALKTEKSFDYVFYFSGASLNYFNHNHNEQHIIDYVDVDSLKWKSYALEKLSMRSLLYYYEYLTLKSFEKYYLGKADKAVFVTQKESDLFTQSYNISSDLKKKIHVIENHIDTEFFTPSMHFKNPYIDNNHDNKFIIIFSGDMGYKPNEDAALYFSEHIMPALKSNIQKNILFVIAGRNPSDKVRFLSQENRNILVTGTVKDMRPYLYYADLCVCPLLIARGIQNKILEAMAMQKTVIASSVAFEGIKAEKEQDLFVADSPEEWSKIITDLYENPKKNYQIGVNALNNIKEKYHSETMKDCLKLL